MDYIMKERIIDFIYDNKQESEEEIKNKAFKESKDLELKQRYEFMNNIVNETTKKRCYNYSEASFIEDILKMDDEEEYIEKNMSELLDLQYTMYDFESGLYKKLEELNPEKFKKLKPKIIKKLLSDACVTLNDNVLLSGLVNIFDEVAKNEGVNFSDIEEIGDGNEIFSHVYKLGNKVIKLGRTRLIEKMPYHRRILLPLIRRKIKLENNKTMFVEVSEYVEPYKPKDQNESEKVLYSIFKELLEDGIVWLDARSANIGKLTKKNIVNMKDKKDLFDSKNETVGFIKDTIKEEEPLNEGEYVILDTDALMTKKDFDNGKMPSNYSSRIYDYFYAIYEKEKGQENNENDEIQLT